MFSLYKPSDSLIRLVKNTIRFNSSTISSQYMIEKPNMLLKDLLAKLQEKIPLELACDWDNVGVLVEPNESFLVKKIMITNDLTEPVLDEAINENVNMIISYHPPIFRPFKSIKQNNWKERILSKCLMNKIAIYSPHTALDAIQDGINDWLLSPFDCKEIRPIEQSLIKASDFHKNLSIKEFQINLRINDETFVKKILDKNLSIQLFQVSNHDPIWSIHCNGDSLSLLLDLINKSDEAQILTVISNPKLPLLNIGMGRIGYLSKPLTITQIIDSLKQNLKLEKFRLALANNHNQDALINSIGVCAGSGSSLLSKTKADFFITGEMSHHEILDAIHGGTSLALCEHSNTERGYLKSHFLQYLIGTFPQIPIIMSKVDRDPIQIV